MVVNRIRNAKEGFVEYNVGNGILKVSISNGRVIYIEKDLEIGSNNYNLGVCHVYNSSIDNDYYGEGFKLDIDQRIKEISGKKYYIDAVGDLCPLESMINLELYDTTGYGLVLKKTNNNLNYLEDDNEKRLYFASNGRLFSSSTKVSDSKRIDKMYELNDKYISVYDTRKTDRKIMFEYLNNLLSSMVVVDPTEICRKNFYYNNKKLTNIVLYQNSKIIGGTIFKYDNLDRLISITSLDDSKTIELTYEDNRIVKVIETYSKISKVIGYMLDGMPFLNKEIEENISQKLTSKKCERRSITYTDIVYGNYYTETINEKGIKLRYYLNSNKEVKSVFEVVNGNLFTLQKDSKDSIEDITDSHIVTESEKINGHSSFKLININNGYQILNVKEQKIDCQYGVISFWFKYNGILDDDEQLKLDIQFYSTNSQSNYVEAHKYLDINANNTYVYIEMPLYFPILYLNSHFNKIGFKTSGTGVFYITNIRFNVCTNSFLTFNNDDSNGMQSSLLDALKIELVDYSNPIILNSVNYLTESDIFANAKNMYNGRNYLIYNDGKKRLSDVSDIKLEIKNITNLIDLKYEKICYKQLSLNRKTLIKRHFIPQNDSNTILNVTTEYEADYDNYKNGKFVYKQKSLKYSLVNKYNRTMREDTDFGSTHYSYNPEYGYMTSKSYLGRGNNIPYVAFDYIYDGVGENIYKEIKYSYEVETEEGLDEERYVKANEEEIIYDYGYDSEKNYFVTCVNQGRKTTHTYDYSNRLKKVNNKNSTYQDTNLLYENKIEYDLLQNKTTLTYANNCYFEISNDLDLETQTYKLSTSNLKTKNLLKNTKHEVMASNDIYSDTLKNRGSITKIYNKYGQLIEEKNSGVTRLTFEYDYPNESKSLSKIIAINDHSEKMKYEYLFEDEEQIGYKKINNNSESSSYNTIISSSKVSKSSLNNYIINNNENISFKVTNYIYNTKSQDLLEVYNDKKQIIETSYGSNNLEVKNYLNYTKYKKKYYYRLDGRLSSIVSSIVSEKATNNESTKEYSYEKDNIIKESLSLSDNLNDTIVINYNYSLGNIKDIIMNRGHIDGINYQETKKITYIYDNQNQVVGEENEKLGMRYGYAYNSNGNLVRITSNLLTSRVSDEVVLDYDSLNRYRGMPVDDYYLKEFTYDGDNLNPSKIDNKEVRYDNKNRVTKIGEISFAYDSLGKRTVKTVPTSISSYNNIEYTYIGDNLVREHRSGMTLEYFYDLTGISNFTVTTSGKTDHYYYVKDILGNVIYITKDNVIQAEYRYDAWGNHKVYDGAGVLDENAATIGNINPIRYRSYFYDTETKLYYLNSRYYDSEICRFITADSLDYLDPSSINGLNLYCYCKNNPVMMVDPDGHFPIMLLIIAGILASGAVNGLAAASSKIESESFWGAFTGGFIDGVIGTTGVAIGLATGGIGGLIITAGIGFVGGAIGNTIGQIISYGNVELKPVLMQGGISALTNSAVYIGMAVAGITTGEKWIEKFIDSIKISSVGIGTSGYFAYYSFQSANSLRENK